MDFLQDCLFWLDASPGRQGTAATASFALVVIGVLLPGWSWPRAWMRHGLWFAAAVILALFVFRWPTWFYRDDLNPDESQIIAGALTLDRYHLVWKYLDTTTHGPFCEYGLVLAHRLTGAPYHYATARVLAALLEAATLLALWGTLRRFTDEATARLGILPGLAFWCFVPWDDFLHYSSELPGIALLALAGWGIAVLLTMPGDRPAAGLVAGLTGIALAAVPFGKLQSAPHAAALLLIAAALVWFAPSHRPHRLRLLLWLAGGVLLVAATLAAYLQFHSLWREFWLTYVKSALAFLGTSAFPFTSMPGRFFNFAATSATFSFFLWGNLAFAVLWLREPVADPRLRIARRLAWALLGVAWFTVLRPGRESAHYLHLLVAPLTLLVGLTLAVTTLERGVRTPTAWLAFGLLALGPQFYDCVVSGNRFHGYAAEHWHAPKSAVAQFILQRAAPNDTMAMWGWEPRLFVEVQLPHATREAQSGNQIMQWPMTRFFVERYLADLRDRRPEWFVDVVGPGAFIFDSRATQAHESVAALREFVAERYELRAEIGSTRIYRLKSRHEPAG